LGKIVWGGAKNTNIETGEEKHMQKAKGAEIRSVGWPSIILIVGGALRRRSWLGSSCGEEENWEGKWVVMFRTAGRLRGGGGGEGKGVLKSL
jgi:hypothetical protein